MLEAGQTVAGPLTTHGGGTGATVRTTSSVLFEQVEVTVSRRVTLVPAADEGTCTEVVNDPGETIVAPPDTTVQLVETAGTPPTLTAPLNENVVIAP